MPLRKAKYYDISHLLKDYPDAYYYMAFGNEVAIHLNNHHTLRALKCCLELRDKVDNSDDHFGQYTWKSPNTICQCLRSL